MEKEKNKELVIIEGDIEVGERERDNDHIYGTSS
jgi:hypothetical protein